MEIRDLEHRGWGIVVHLSWRSRAREETHHHYDLNVAEGRAKMKYIVSEQVKTVLSWCAGRDAA